MKVCDLTEDLLWFVCGLYVGILTSSLSRAHQISNNNLNDRWELCFKLLNFTFRNNFCNKIIHQTLARGVLPSSPWLHFQNEGASLEWVKSFTLLNEFPNIIRINLLAYCMQIALI